MIGNMTGMRKCVDCGERYANWGLGRHRCQECHAELMQTFDREALLVALYHKAVDAGDLTLAWRVLASMK